MNRRSFRSLLRFAPCALALSCGGGPAKPADPVTKANAPVDSTETPPVVTTNPTASPADKTPTDKTPAPKKPESPFHVHAEGDEEMRLYAAGDTLYVAGSHLVDEVTAAGVEPVDPHETPEKEDDYSSFGLPNYGRVAEVGGNGRDQTFLTFLTDNGRIGLGVLYRRQGASWKLVKRKADGTIYAGMSPWHGGRVLTMTRGAGFNSAIEPSKFEIITGAAAPLPKLTAEKGCPSKVVPAIFKGLPSGEVVVYGTRCKHTGEEGWAGVSFTGEPLVEYWAAGSTKGVVIPLVADAKTEVSEDLESSAVFAGSSGKELYLSLGTDAETTHLYRFDGASFKREDVGDVGRIISMSLAPDGALWAVTSAGGVLSRAPGKTFVEVPLPEGHAAWSVHVKSDGSTWVLTNTGGNNTGLLTTGAPPAKVARVAATDKNDFKLVKPATSKCKTLFVMLYAFTKVTPPDYDFPLTRQAVKGKTRYKTTRFVVTEVSGKKFFGAFVPDLETGRALTTLVEAEVKGSKPQLVCHDPKVLSEFKLNITTGEREK